MLDYLEDSFKRLHMYSLRTRVPNMTPPLHVT